MRDGNVIEARSRDVDVNDDNAKEQTVATLIAFVVDLKSTTPRNTMYTRATRIK